MPVDAIIFDLDDTLIVEVAQARTSLLAAAALVPDQVPERVEETVRQVAGERWRAGPHADLARELGIASWEGLWATFDGGHARLDGLRDWAGHYRREVWPEALRRMGIDDEELAASLAAAYVASQRAGHPLIEGTAEAVRAVGGHRRLGLLTNGPADIQRHKFAGTGLVECFDAVVISGEAGVGKPDPAVFHLVLEDLGTTAATTVMVGDSWTRDVEGALGVGMAAVWVAGGRTPPPSHPDVTVVDRVADLPALSL